MSKHDGTTENSQPPLAEVGYKRPPKHTQFAKGRSGNPSGRPKRPDGISIRELLDSDQRGKNGEVISKREALVVRLMNDAMAGNQKAFGRFLNLLTEAGLLTWGMCVSRMSSYLFVRLRPPFRPDRGLCRMTRADQVKADPLGSPRSGLALS